MKNGRWKTVDAGQKMWEERQMTNSRYKRRDERQDAREEIQERRYIDNIQYHSFYSAALQTPFIPALLTLII